MEHRRLDGGIKKHLYSAFNKYGIDKFIFSILEECTKEESIQKEKEYIQKYDSYKNGYNETLGGEDGEVSSLYDSRYEIINLLKDETKSMKYIAEKYNVTIALICMVNKGKRCYIEGEKYPIRKPKEKKKAYCIDCGKEIGYRAKRCKSCNTKLIKMLESKKPTSEELINEILKTSIKDTSKKYGVAIKTIKKWLKSYNEPCAIKDIYAKYAPERLIKPKKEKYKYSAGYDETKKVKMWNDTICHTFSNVDMCAKYINKTIDSDIEDIKYGIRRVIRGKRQTYHGYSFCYL